VLKSKKIKFIMKKLFVLAFVASSFALVSCGAKTETAKADTAVVAAPVDTTPVAAPVDSAKVDTTAAPKVEEKK